MKIEEAVVEPAELDPTEQPLTYNQLMADITKSVGILDDDFGHFLALSLQDKRRFYKAFKRVNPQTLRPEHKANFQWLCDFMKEEIGADESEGGEQSIEEEKPTVTGGVYKAESFAGVNSRGAKKDFTPEQVEEFAATLKTKTAVAQALGFYGAPGFNNRLATDPAIKAAYERGCARRQV